jgi:hypothetical protein
MSQASTTNVAHVPGPWTYWVTRSGRIWVIAKEDVRGPFICETRTSEATARLISAAPDLYSAALRLQGSAVHPQVGEMYTVNVLGEDLVAIRAAIAKAEGRKS